MNTFQNGVVINLPNLDISTSEKFIEEHYSSYTLTGIAEFIAPLIEKLAMLHPEWQFKGGGVSRFNKDSPTAVVQGFEVYDKREKIGELSMEYSYGRHEFLYLIGNKRISGKMQRGSCAKTADVNKAIKLVKKNFSKANYQEVFTGEFNQAARGLAHRLSYAQQEATSLWMEDTPIFKKFVLSNWGDFLSSCNTEQFDRLSPLPDKIDKAYEIKVINNARDNKQTYNIVQQDGTYLVQHKDKLSVKSAEELPDFVRRKLGMLKLVQDHETIDGVGYRHNNHTFIVLGEGNE